MRRFHFVSAAVLFLPSAVLATTIIPMAHIGNVGNAGDPRARDEGNAGYGAIGNDYSIGKYEVTAGQYTDFLNAVAKSDPNFVYNTMQGDPDLGCGISRYGSSGNYTYGVNPAYASRPVIWVSFYDAARFANWLHNGQPSGAQSASTTEEGAYTLRLLDGLTRNAGAKWAIPSENEWYKAAYHQPATQGGDPSDYWLYPTASNTITGADANYYDSMIGATTPVGSYDPNFYGAFDMGGNVNEWCDTIYPQYSNARALQGGSYLISEVELRATYISPDGIPYNETPWTGFRVVQIPGPSGLALLGAAGGCLLIAGRRRSC